MDINNTLDGEYPVQDSNFIGSGERVITGVDDSVYQPLENNYRMSPEEAAKRMKNYDGCDA